MQIILAWSAIVAFCLTVVVQGTGNKYNPPPPDNPFLLGNSSDMSVIHDGAAWWLFVLEAYGFPPVAYRSDDLISWGLNYPLNREGAAWAEGSLTSISTIHRNEKYFVYLTAFNGNGHHLGVAIAEKASGPYVATQGEPLIAGDGLQYGISFLDPNLNFDLNFDLDINSDLDADAELPTGYTLVGDPLVFKRNITYYLTWTSRRMTEPFDLAIRYGTASSPTGPFSYAGYNAILDITNARIAKAPTFHRRRSFFNASDDWYVVYTRKDLVPGDYAQESLALDPVSFNRDDTLTPLVPVLFKPGPGKLDMYGHIMIFEAKLMIVDEGNQARADAGLVFHVTNPQDGNRYNGYYVGLRISSGTIVLARVDSGTRWTDLASTNASIVKNVWHTLNIETDDTSGQIEIIYTDKTYAFGRSGVRVSYSTALFKDFILLKTD
ncbi:glycosyl hydrolase [Podospora didyma]|uniref:Glycosyl hydrolase n=1 Tax=Podospora didyma TaxID=330526 RepID=A0AAE0KKL5_9PEZI|nr:glycosyl hydrolase [Podospora didyma]